MERARLETYLRGRMGDVRIERMIRAFPGFSRETWLVWFAGGEGVVVRAEPAGGGLVPVPFIREWRVYEALGRTKIPVARALWYDAAPEPTDGRPLFVRTLVEGSAYPTGLHDDTVEAAARRRRVAEEHAEKLALLHKLDWRQAGFGAFLTAPDSPRDALRHELKTWEVVWHQVKTEAFPVVSEALGWLEARLPA